jgi:UDP-glucose 4-epimerase
MHYLVTGGAGFIGSNLVRKLLQLGHEVRVLDDFSSGKAQNLSDLPRQIGVFNGSITDEKMVEDAVCGMDGVFHQAAIPAVPRSIEDPLGTHQVNATGTLMLLEACRQQGIARLVFAASSSAYGNIEADVKVEHLTPDPCSPYAAQKLMAESYCKVYTETMGMPAIALRYFNVYGPNQAPDSAYAAVIPAFIRKMLHGQRPVVFGDGLQSRDFTFIDDVVAVNLAAMSADDGATGKVYNVACGERTTLLDLIEMLNKVLGTNLEPDLKPERAGDVRHSLADISRAKNMLGWSPNIDLESGLRQTVEWLRQGGY